VLVRKAHLDSGFRRNDGRVVTVTLLRPIAQLGELEIENDPADHFPSERPHTDVLAGAREE